MPTMHAQDFQHDNSREADEVLEEFRSLFRRARRHAEVALRAHREATARRAAAARRDLGRRDAERETPGKTQVHVRDGHDGVSPEWISRWAAAHATADVLREEAREAQATDARDQERAANAERDADVAETWADSWDERIRDAGIDPDTLSTDADTDRSPGIDDDALSAEIDAQAAEMAIDAADMLSTPPNESRSVGELINDTHAEGIETGEAAPSPSLAAVGAPGLDTAAALDAGAEL